MTRIFAVSQDWPITINPPPLRRGRGGEENYVRKEEIKGYMYYSREKRIYGKL